MIYDVGIYLLSQKFINEYPNSEYPELLSKHTRPYNCLLIQDHDYYICIPYRSSISHDRAFLFTGTKRSMRMKSGLDYSKIVIIKNGEYLDSNEKAIVDQDEYRETMANIDIIAREAVKYVDEYINHMKGNTILHEREFQRRYQYSTLKYFHELLGIND